VTTTLPDNTEEEALDPEDFIRALLNVSSEEATAVREDADTKAD
jgi:hypothetical protein